MFLIFYFEYKGVLLDVSIFFGFGKILNKFNSLLRLIVNFLWLFMKIYNIEILGREYRCFFN